MSERTRELEWAGAEVHGGVLTVPLSGTASKSWSEHFGAVLRLLDRSKQTWDGVSLSKKAVEVRGMQPGAEDDVRHFLESIVVQVNSELAPAEDRTAAEDRDSLDPQERADLEMTESLRAFADGAEN